MAVPLFPQLPLLPQLRKSAEPLSTYSNLVLVGYHKLAGQRHISKLGEAPSKGLPNLDFGGRMQTHPNDLRCAQDRIPKDIAEIGVERYEYSSFTDGSGANLRIAGARKADVLCGDGIITRLAKMSGMARRKVLVEKELHASVRTISSPASAAAYSKQARRSCWVS